MKINKILLSLLSTAVLISGCSYMPQLKRSSSNKLIDMEGFQGNKRKPLYNKKYITKAKQNVINNDYDDEEDEDSELINPQKNNLAMYKKMVRGKKDNNRSKYEDRKSAYIDSISEDEDSRDLVKSRKQMSNMDESQNKSELENEIVEIRQLLQKTRDEITKAKCPYGETKKVAPKRKAQSVDIDDELDDLTYDRPKQKTKPVVKARPGAMTSVIKD